MKNNLIAIYHYLLSFIIIVQPVGGLALQQARALRLALRGWMHCCTMLCYGATCCKYARLGCAVVHYAMLWCNLLHVPTMSSFPATGLFPTAPSVFFTTALPSPHQEMEANGGWKVNCGSIGALRGLALRLLKRIDPRRYDTVITIHQLHSHLMDDIHQES